MRAFLFAIALCTSTHAFAAPDIQFFTLEGSGTNQRCGFPLIVEYGGMIVDHVWIHEDGSAEEIATFPTWRFTFRNPANGKSVTSEQPEVLRWSYDPDGSITEYSTGLHALFTISGVGLVTAAVGRIVFEYPEGFDGPRSVLFEAGEHVSPFPEICAYLR